jgi:hypothetical protein
LESILDVYDVVFDADTVLAAIQEGLAGAPEDVFAALASAAKRCEEAGSTVRLAPLLRAIRRLELARRQRGFYDAKREIFFRCRTSDPTELAIVIADYDRARWFSLRTKPQAKIVETVYLADGNDVWCKDLPELAKVRDLTDAIGRINDQCDGGRSNPILKLRGKPPRRRGQRRVPGEVEESPIENRFLLANPGYRMVDLRFESLKDLEEQSLERLGPPSRDVPAAIESEAPRSNQRA